MAVADFLMASTARASSRSAHKFAWSEFEQPKAGPKGEGQDARSKHAVEAGEVRTRRRDERREFGDEVHRIRGMVMSIASWRPCLIVRFGSRIPEQLVNTSQGILTIYTL